MQNKIDAILSKLIKHPLLPIIDNKYYSDFKMVVQNLSQTITSPKIEKRLLEKLLLSEKRDFDFSKYLQGVSEVNLLNYFLSEKFIVEPDKKLRGDNNTDVDMSVIINNVRINFEVKCPVLPKSNGSDFIIKEGFRTVSKDIYDSQVKPVIEKIGDMIVDGSKGSASSFEIAKNNDNKLCEYLKSCQMKFDYSPDCLNVLVFSTPIHSFADYYYYLNNPYSGIFDIDAKIRFIKPEEFDKVDVIWFTTFIDKHINKSERYNAWTINDVFNIFMINPLSKHIISASEKKESFRGGKELLERIPNETMRFDDFAEKYTNTLNNPNDTEMRHDLYTSMIRSYLDKYHEITQQ